jgi:cell division protein FtsZ
MLVNITANEDLGMDEFSEAASYIGEAARGPNGEEPDIIPAMSLDESCGDEIRITVIATGIETDAQKPAQEKEEGTPVSKPETAAPEQGGRRRDPSSILSRPRLNDDTDDRESPAYLRYSDKARQYQTGDSFTFEEDDDPAFIRKQDA